jgi:hypothetical protein
LRPSSCRRSLRLSHLSLPPSPPSCSPRHECCASPTRSAPRPRRARHRSRAGGVLRLELGRAACNPGRGLWQRRRPGRQRAGRAHLGHARRTWCRHIFPRSSVHSRPRYTSATGHPAGSESIHVADTPAQSADRVSALARGHAGPTPPDQPPRTIGDRTDRACDNTERSSRAGDRAARCASGCTPDSSDRANTSATNSTPGAAASAAHARAPHPAARHWRRHTLRGPRGRRGGPIASRRRELVASFRLPCVN